MSRKDKTAQRKGNERRSEPVNVNEIRDFGTLGSGPTYADHTEPDSVASRRVGATTRSLALPT